MRLLFKNGDTYVLKSKNPEQTFVQYLINLRANRHSNKALQEAYNTHGRPILEESEDLQGSLNQKLPNSRKYSSEQLIKVLELIIEGNSAKQVSEITKVHISTVNNIANKYSHKWLAEYFPHFYD